MHSYIKRKEHLPMGKLHLTILINRSRQHVFIYLEGSKFKTASDTALVELTSGNALDTLIPVSQLISDRFVVVFFPTLLFSFSSNNFLIPFLIYFFRVHSTWFRVLGIMVAKRQLT